MWIVYNYLLLFYYRRKQNAQYLIIAELIADTLNKLWKENEYVYIYNSIMIVLIWMIE